MSNPVQKIIGNSSSLRATLAKARKVGRSDLSVLINGESGTGKELFAQFIHDQSRRAKKPFVAVNCAAIPGELLETELFGHKKGAFSGAVSDREGLFMQANGGTLFLDEIGDMPLPLQAKILRVLQEGEIRPVGGKVVQKVDVRILAATHRDLDDHVAQKQFREDLLFRLRVYAITIPPLRERGQDAIVLVRHFLKNQPTSQTKYLSQDARDFLLQHSWPGNIRELQNVVLATTVDSPRTINAHHIHTHLGNNTAANFSHGDQSVLERIRTFIMEVGSASLTDIRTELYLPKSTAHRHVTSMERAGQIHRSGNNRSTRYLLCATS